MSSSQIKQEQKKFVIKTFGCQMNVYDSEKIENIMNSLGYSKSEDYQDANCVILNTCHIREKATEKIYSELGRIKREKIKMQNQGKEMIISVVGCVAQAEGEEIFSRSSAVDIVAGPESYQDLPELIKKVQTSGGKYSSLDFKPEEKFDFLEQELIQKSSTQTAKPSEFITVQEGCDKFCTFCVVPYTRGAEFSRNVEAVLENVEKLADQGTREVVLLGQNVNAYHGKDKNGKTWSLAQLITKIAQNPKIARIRYTTSHPLDFTDELIAVHASEPKLMPILNLPVQSGSDEILKKMNRNHTQQDYINIIKKLQKVRPDLIMSSDFIVGFPGESDEDFNQTIKLIEEVKFQSQCFSFKYSQRPGTPAATKNQVDEDVKSQRLAKLQDLLEQQRQDYNKSFLGKEVEILFDNKETREQDQIGGRTQFNQIAMVKVENQSQKNRLYGTINKAIVTKVHSNTLECQLVLQ